MRVQLRDIVVPDFGIPVARPLPPPETYSARCDRLVAAANVDWVVVYADREHLANVVFLSCFEPRFEEALLLLGRHGERILLCGNESLPYATIARLPALETKLCQSLSLMGQDRSEGPSLKAVLRDCGIAPGQAIGIVGWKYLGSAEWEEGEPALYIPAAFVQILRRIIRDSGRLSDCTALLMDAESGHRAVVDADEIAMLEWGSARGLSGSVEYYPRGSRRRERTRDCEPNALCGRAPILPYDALVKRCKRSDSRACQPHGPATLARRWYLHRSRLLGRTLGPRRTSC